MVSRSTSSFLDEVADVRVGADALMRGVTQLPWSRYEHPQAGTAVRARRGPEEQWSVKKSSDGIYRSSSLTELCFAAETGPKITMALTSRVAFDTTGRAVDYVRAQAVSHPSLRAIVAAGSVISYRHLAKYIAEASSLLLASGCRAGDVVACRGHRGAYTPILFLAIESIGAVYLPLDPDWPPARICEVLEQSGSTLLIDYTATELGNPRIRIIEGADERSGAVSALTGGEARYVIYTSGTTGRPKGAIVAQAGMMNHLWAKICALALTSGDRVAFTAPLVFDISIWQMIAPLMVGASVVIATSDDIRFPPRLCRLLVRHEVSVVELVPTAISALFRVTARWKADQVLPCLRWLVSTGEELRPSLAAVALTALPGTGLLNAYGPAECSDDVTHHVVSAADTIGQRLPIGRPIGGASIYCLNQDPADGSWSATEPGGVGEIFVGGVPVGLGYLGDTDATHNAFFRDTLDLGSPTGRIYRTGDLGRIDRGVIYYIGRVDRQVKLGGVRMELDEVEAALGRHPAVSQCAVTLCGGHNQRQLLTAHYVPQLPVSAQQLKTFLQAALPASLVPRRWEQLDVLPLTPNGKVDHRALSARTSGKRVASCNDDG